MALHHVSPGEKVHLPSAALRAKTTALVKTDGFEAIELVLAAGEVIARHSVPGFATIQCIAGSMTVETHEKIELRAGDWLYLARHQEHGVRSLEDSVALLTITLT